MCKYCENNSNSWTGISEPLINTNIKIGDILTSILQVNIYQSKLCLDILYDHDDNVATPGEIKIIYCPVCGEKLSEYIEDKEE